MGQLIDDDVLSAFAVIGEPSVLADQIALRFGDDVHRISLLDITVGPMLLQHAA
jgi:hypothetical protein